MRLSGGLSVPNAAASLNAGGAASVEWYNNWRRTSQWAAELVQRFIYADDYGVVADGSTDNAAALAALTEKIGAGHKTVILPYGVICTSQEWDLSDLVNVVFEGHGGLDLTYSANSGTVIKYTGDGSGSIINMQDHRGVWWRNVQVVYTSDSFMGIAFNCATSFTTGCGSGFERCQVYQVGANGHPALAGWYLKNNVDVTFHNCYASHFDYGWVGLFSGDVGETNMIKLYSCTSIGCGAAGVVNPRIGWNFYSHNFEPSDANAPAGIISAGGFDIQDLSLYSCKFADSTANGSWIDLSGSNTFNFTMIGGDILALSGTVNGIKLGSSFNGAPVIIGVTFDGIAVAIDYSAATTGAVSLGHNFLSTATPYAGLSNIDPGSIVGASNPDLKLPLRLPSYTVAGVPTAVEGGLIFVSNESGGAVPAFGSGGNWLRVTDRAVIS